MKHILGFNEALKGKGLSSYDIDTTDCEKIFNSFEEGEAQMKIIMKVFEKKFREVYPRGSVYDATFDEMSKYFDMF